MPILEVKTISSKKVWEAADGQRKIYELQLEYEGQPVRAKTYSGQIATVGWSGKVDTYEKTGRNGIETFVKQPPKENGQYGGSSPTATQGSRSSGYQAKDEKAIQAMWAIGQAVTLTTLSKAEGDEKLALVESAAQELFAMVARVKASEDAPAAPEPDEVQPVTDAPVDLSMVDKVFNTEPEPEEELPWPKPQS